MELNHRGASNAIVLGCSANRGFAVAVFLASLIETNNLFDTDVIVFHNGLSRIDQDAINRIHKVKFVTYQVPASLENKTNESVDYFTPVIFSKFECLRLLEYYSCVAWFDYDMIVSDDIHELFVPVPGGMKAIIGDRIASYLSGALQDDSTLNRFSNALGIHGSCLVFFQGIGDHIRLYQWCIDECARLISVLGCPDQLVFSLMIHEFSIEFYPLSFDLYSQHPELRKSLPFSKYVKIWHSFKMHKYWEGYYYDSEWARYFVRYVWYYLQAQYEIEFPSKPSAYTDSAHQQIHEMKQKLTKPDTSYVTLHGYVFPIRPEKLYGALVDALTQAHLWPDITSVDEQCLLLKPSLSFSQFRAEE